MGYQNSNSRFAFLMASPASESSAKPAEAGNGAPRKIKSHTSSVSSSARSGCEEESAFPYMSPPWNRCATQ